MSKSFRWLLGILLVGGALFGYDYWLMQGGGDSTLAGWMFQHTAPPCGRCGRPLTITKVNGVPVSSCEHCLNEVPPEDKSAPIAP